MINVLTLNDIKQALWKADFRELFPEYQKEINAFLAKPDCACNGSLLKKILNYKDRLKAYFPDKEMPEELDNWKVINCNINDLSKELKKLPRGQKQISMARYQEQVTVIVNIL